MTKNDKESERRSIRSNQTSSELRQNKTKILRTENNKKSSHIKCTPCSNQTNGISILNSHKPHHFSFSIKFRSISVQTCPSQDMNNILKKPSRRKETDISNTENSENSVCVDCPNEENNVAISILKSVISNIIPIFDKLESIPSESIASISKSSHLDNQPKECEKEVSMNDKSKNSLCVTCPPCSNEVKSIAVSVVNACLSRIFSFSDKLQNSSAENSETVLNESEAQYGREEKSEIPESENKGKSALTIYPPSSKEVNNIATSILESCISNIFLFSDKLRSISALRRSTVSTNGVSNASFIKEKKDFPKSENTEEVSAVNYLPSSNEANDIGISILNSCLSNVFLFSKKLESDSEENISSKLANIKLNAQPEGDKEDLPKTENSLSMNYPIESDEVNNVAASVLNSFLSNISLPSDKQRSSSLKTPSEATLQPKIISEEKLPRMEKIEQLGTENKEIGAENMEEYKCIDSYLNLIIESFKMKAFDVDDDEFDRLFEDLRDELDKILCQCAEINPEMFTKSPSRVNEKIDTEESIGEDHKFTPITRYVIEDDLKKMFDEMRNLFERKLCNCEDKGTDSIRPIPENDTRKQELSKPHSEEIKDLEAEDKNKTFKSHVPPTIFFDKVTTSVNQTTNQNPDDDKKFIDDIEHDEKQLNHPMEKHRMSDMNKISEKDSEKPKEENLEKEDKNKAFKSHVLPIIFVDKMTTSADDVISQHSYKEKNSLENININNRNMRSIPINIPEEDDMKEGLEENTDETKIMETEKKGRTSKKQMKPITSYDKINSNADRNMYQDIDDNDELLGDIHPSEYNRQHGPTDKEETNDMEKSAERNSETIGNSELEDKRGKFKEHVLPIIFCDKITATSDEEAYKNIGGDPRLFDNFSLNDENSVKEFVDKYKNDQDKNAIISKAASDGIKNSREPVSAIANNASESHELEQHIYSREVDDEDFVSVSECSKIIESEETYLTLLDRVALNPMNISDLFPHQVHILQPSEHPLPSESFFTANCSNFLEEFLHQVSKHSSNRATIPQSQCKCVADKKVGTHEHSKKSHVYIDGESFSLQSDEERVAEVAIKRELNNDNENVDKIKVRIRLKDERNPKTKEPAKGSEKSRDELTLNKSQKFSKSFVDFNVKCQTLKETIVHEPTVVTEGGVIKILIPLESNISDDEIDTKI